MKVFELKQDLIAFLQGKNSVGFVPTMGALHLGHISLIELSASKAETTVCSIFVNPAQFNDKNDLINYPRTIDKDLKLLEKYKCDAVFIPDYKEIYPDGDVLHQYNFGQLETIMEGAHRPGHFNGMANVVQRLLEIVKPHVAFFGEKDFQQLAVVKELVKQMKLPIEIIAGAIIREQDGLAMSSRNALLTNDERQQANGIYKSLKKVKENNSITNPQLLIDLIREEIKNYPLIATEYIEIRSDNMSPITQIEKGRGARVFIAVRLGKVRLIDNMVIG